MKTMNDISILHQVEKLIAKYKVVLAAIAGAILIVIPFLTPTDYILRVVCLIIMYCSFGFSLNLLLGEMGLMSMGQAGFVGIGAYTTAIILTTLNWNFIPATICGALVAAVFGLLIGLPTLRLHGPYLAIVTIGFGEIMRTVFLNWTSLTGGPLGIRNIPRPELFGLELNYENKGFYYIVLFVAVLSGIFCTAIHKSKYGRAFAVIKQDEIAAMMIGIKTTRYKVMGFVFSAAISALMGGYYAMMQRYIDSTSFTSDMSIMIVGCVIIGGARTLRVPILWAVLMVAFPEEFLSLEDYRIVI